MSDALRPRVSAGRRANAATGDGARLTGPRREVLAALMECGPADAEAIAAQMRARHQSEGEHFGDAITASVSQLLWRMQALGWVQPLDGGFAITADGIAAVAGRSKG